MIDIRRFLCKRKKIENEQFNGKDCPSTSAQQSTSKTESTTQQTSVNIYDVGLYQDSNVPISDEIQFKVLETPWKPQDYDFKQDIDHKNVTQQRAFRHEWFTAFPWIAYSAQAKGPLCRTLHIHVYYFPHKFTEAVLKCHLSFNHAKNIKNFMSVRNLMQIASGIDTFKILHERA
ncbi:unnamed protein product [Leptidea sinapis]|uniref:Uncharacterized protein n=1 Tax=Leptidea sinapis TaxID=189913 RepID=A0A5E4QDK4_9NEOP|nr:unnamed protein product [Leptidea sinapis]